MNLLHFLPEDLLWAWNKAWARHQKRMEWLNEKYKKKE